MSFPQARAMLRRDGTEFRGVVSFEDVRVIVFAIFYNAITRRHIYIGTKRRENAQKVSNSDHKKAHRDLYYAYFRAPTRQVLRGVVR